MLFPREPIAGCAGLARMTEFRTRSAASLMAPVTIFRRAGMRVREELSAVNETCDRLGWLDGGFGAGD